MSLRRISIVFLVWLLATGAMVAYAEDYTTLSAPESGAEYTQYATIGVEGDSPYTSGTLMVYIKIEQAIQDSQVVEVQETGEFWHNFDAPPPGWTVDNGYTCQVKRGGVEVASVNFKVVDDE